jgi:hypothetical protein
VVGVRASHRGDIIRRERDGWACDTRTQGEDRYRCMDDIKRVKRERMLEEAEIERNGYIR